MATTIMISGKRSAVMTAEKLDVEGLLIGSSYVGDKGIVLCGKNSYLSPTVGTYLHLCKDSCHPNGIRPLGRYQRDSG